MLVCEGFCKLDWESEAERQFWCDVNMAYKLKGQGKVPVAWCMIMKNTAELHLTETEAKEEVLFTCGDL